MKKKYSITRISLLLIGGFLLCLNTQAQNLIKNGDFTNGETGWNFNVNKKHGAVASFSYDNGQGKVVIANSGINGSQIAIKQNIELIAGHKYILTFDAKTSASKKQPIYFYTPQIKQRPLSAVTQSYTQKEYSWTQKATGTVQVQIRLGDSTGTIWIDNVVLIDKSGK
jgi:hypothetical protein